VREAIEEGIPAGLVFGVPKDFQQQREVPVIAFDCDSTLCSDESDRAYEQGKMPGFREFEFANSAVVMGNGPLREFAQALSKLRDEHPFSQPPFRIAMITSRDFQFSDRPLRTFREWGLRLDEAFFVSDMSKSVVLQALNPLIFFDDNRNHCADAAVLTPTVQIPSKTPCVGLGVNTVEESGEPIKFITVCKLYLKTDFTRYEQLLVDWHSRELIPMGPAKAVKNS